MNIVLSIPNTMKWLLLSFIFLKCLFCLFLPIYQPPYCILIWIQNLFLKIIFLAFVIFNSLQCHFLLWRNFIKVTRRASVPSCWTSLIAFYLLLILFSPPAWEHSLETLNFFPFTLPICAWLVFLTSKTSCS